MAKYQLNIDRRTRNGRSVYNLLDDLDYIKDDCVDIDERNSFNRNLVFFLLESNMLTKKFVPDRITQKVSELFLKNRTANGELSDKELNSQITTAKYLSKEL